MAIKPTMTVDDIRQAQQVTGDGLDRSTLPDSVKHLSTPPTDFDGDLRAKLDAYYQAEKVMEGKTTYFDLLGNKPTALQKVGDAIIGAGSGAISGIAGALNIPIALASNEAGVTVAQGIQNMQGYFADKQSTGTQAQLQAEAIRNRTSERANELQYQTDIANGVTPLSAGTNRFFSDVGSTLNNMNSTTAINNIANATGSLVAGGVVRGGLVRGLNAMGVVVGSGSRVVAGLESMGNKVLSGVSEGIVAAGSNYVQTSNEVMGMSYDELNRTSPEFVNLIRQGVSPQDAKLQLANLTGLTSGTLAGISNAVLSGISSKVELNPFSANSVRGGLVNIGREGTEEFGQSTAEALSHNIALKDRVNSNADLLKGVGQSAAEGMIGGIGLAGTTQSPAILRSLAGNTIGALLSGGKSILSNTVEHIAESRANANNPNVGTFNATVESAYSTQQPSSSTTEAVTTNQGLQQTVAKHYPEATTPAQVVSAIQGTFNDIKVNPTADNFVRASEVMASLKETNPDIISDPIIVRQNKQLANILKNNETQLALFDNLSEDDKIKVAVITNAGVLFHNNGMNTPAANVLANSPTTDKKVFEYAKAFLAIKKSIEENKTTFKAQNVSTQILDNNDRKGDNTKWGLQDYFDSIMKLRFDNSKKTQLEHTIDSYNNFVKSQYNKVNALKESVATGKGEAYTTYSSLNGTEYQSTDADNSVANRQYNEKNANEPGFVPKQDGTVRYIIGNKASEKFTRTALAEYSILRDMLQHFKDIDAYTGTVPDVVTIKGINDEINTTEEDNSINEYLSSDGYKAIESKINSYDNNSELTNLLKEKHPVKVLSSKLDNLLKMSRKSFLQKTVEYTKHLEVTNTEDSITSKSEHLLDYHLKNGDSDEDIKQKFIEATNTHLSILTPNKKDLTFIGNFKDEDTLDTEASKLKIAELYKRYLSKGTETDPKERRNALQDKFKSELTALKQKLLAKEGEEVKLHYFNKTLLSDITALPIKEFTITDKDLTNLKDTTTVTVVRKGLVVNVTNFLTNHNGIWYGITYKGVEGTLYKYEITTLPIQPNVSLNIRYGNNENSALSNFQAIKNGLSLSDIADLRSITNLFPTDVIKVHFADTLKNTKFYSVEQLFQFLKLGFSEKSIVTKHIKSIVGEGITGATAKFEGMFIPLDGTQFPQWNVISTNVMRAILAIRYKQDEAFAVELSKTKGYTLTHSQSNDKWGFVFPQILMDIRDNVSTKNSTINLDSLTLKKLEERDIQRSNSDKVIQAKKELVEIEKTLSEYKLPFESYNDLRKVVFPFIKDNLAKVIENEATRLFGTHIVNNSVFKGEEDIPADLLNKYINKFMVANYTDTIYFKHQIQLAELNGIATKVDSDIIEKNKDNYNTVKLAYDRYFGKDLITVKPNTQIDFNQSMMEELTETFREAFSKTGKSVHIKGEVSRWIAEMGKFGYNKLSPDDKPTFVEEVYTENKLNPSSKTSALSINNKITKLPDWFIYELSKATGIDLRTYDVSFLNLYLNGESDLGEHSDVDEHSNAPVVTFYPSEGQIYKDDKIIPTTAGSVVLFANGERTVLHNVSKFTPSVGDTIANYSTIKDSNGVVIPKDATRWTLTMRSNKPVVLFNETTYPNPNTTPTGEKLQTKPTIPKGTDIAITKATYEDLNKLPVIAGSIISGLGRKLFIEQKVGKTVNINTIPNLINIDTSKANNSTDIYSKLGGKTQFKKVVIDKVKGREPSKNSNTIIAFRTKKNDFLKALKEDSAIGNPWNSRGYGLIKTDTVKEAVKEFIAWMIGEKHTDTLQDYRQAIIDRIPLLKNKTILYYEELNEPSHATALDYLINEYDWSGKVPKQQETTTTKPKLSLPPTIKADGKRIKENLQKAFDKLRELPTKSKFDVLLPIGTSGSGKSTFIKSLPQDNLIVIEPDAMRVEFTGNINNKDKDKEIYEVAAKRAVAAIGEGKQVVFDTTNLTKDKRLPFIEAIKKEMPTVNIQYKLMELNPALAKERIKAQITRGENRANVPDTTIDRHAESYSTMLEDIKNEPITDYDYNTEHQVLFGHLKALLLIGSNPSNDEYWLNGSTAAALHWILNSNGTKGSIVRGTTSIEALDNRVKTVKEIEKYKDSHIYWEVNTSIVNYLKDFFNLKGVGDANTGIIDGTFASLAQMIIDAMKASGVLEFSSAISSTDPNIINLNTYKLNGTYLASEQVLAKYKNKIIEVLEITHNTGILTEAMDGSQFNGSWKKIVKTPYQVQESVESTYKRIGVEGYIKLTGNTVNDNDNVNIAEKKKVVRRDITSTYADIGFYAKGIKIFFNFINDLGNGRIRIDTKLIKNPSNSKIIRAIVSILPSTIDLRNEDHLQLANIAINQMFGEKTHKKEKTKLRKYLTEDTLRGVMSLFEITDNEKFVDSLSEWLKKNKVEFSDNALIALTELNSIGQLLYPESNKKATKKQLDLFSDEHIEVNEALTQYKTNLIFTPDGVSNGFFNLLTNFSSGKFTIEELEGWFRGGMNLKEGGSFLDNPPDIYAIAPIVAEKYRTDAIASLTLKITNNNKLTDGEKEEKITRLEHKINIYSRLIIELKLPVIGADLERSAVKDAMLPLLYMSSAFAVSMGRLKAIEYAIYEYIANDQGKLNFILYVLNNISYDPQNGRLEQESQDSKIKYGNIGYYVTDPQKFTFKQEFLEKLQYLITSIETEPLESAVNELLGQSKKNLQVINDGINIMVATTIGAFNRLVIDAYKSDDGKEIINKAHIGLTPNQYKKIEKKLYAMGLDKSVVGIVINYSKTNKKINRDTVVAKLDGDKLNLYGRTTDYDFKEKQGAVQTNLGFGDALMITEAAHKAFFNPEYDGATVPLIGGIDQTIAFNKAIYNNLMNNNFLEMFVERFQTFYDLYLPTEEDNELITDLVGVNIFNTYEKPEPGENQLVTNLTDRMKGIIGKLIEASESHKHRIEILSAIGVNLQQMTGVNGDHYYNDKKHLEFKDTQELVDILNTDLDKKNTKALSIKDSNIKYRQGLNKSYTITGVEEVRRHLSKITNDRNLQTILDVVHLPGSIKLTVLSKEDIPNVITSLKDDLNKLELESSKLTRYSSFEDLSKVNKNKKAKEGLQRKIDMIAYHIAILESNSFKPNNGFVLPGSSTMYIFNDNNFKDINPIIFHELIHAITAPQEMFGLSIIFKEKPDLVDKIKTDVSNSEVASDEALEDNEDTGIYKGKKQEELNANLINIITKRIKLLNKFIKSNPNWETINSPNDVQSISFANPTVNLNYKEQYFKILQLYREAYKDDKVTIVKLHAALQEFSAYGLTEPELSNKLRNTAIGRLFNKLNTILRSFLKLSSIPDSMWSALLTTVSELSKFNKGNSNTVDKNYILTAKQVAVKALQNPLYHSLDDNRLNRLLLDVKELISRLSDGTINDNIVDEFNLIDYPQTTEERVVISHITNLLTLPIDKGVMIGLSDLHLKSKSKFGFNDFVALALGSDSFRAELANVDITNKPNNGKGFNNWIRDITESLFNWIESKYSGQKGNSFKEQIDNVFSKAVKIEDRRTNSLINKVGEDLFDKVHHIEEGGDKYITDKVKTIAEWAFSTKRGKKFSILKGLIHKDYAERGQASFRAVVNGLPVGGINEFFNNVLGASNDENNVLSTIKNVMVKVEQSRELVRETLPSIFLEKFKERPTKQEQKDLFVMGKYNIVAHSFDTLQEVLNNPNQAITDLEGKLNDEAIAKSKQLATYMVTGVVGNNLYRNSYAISQLTKEEDIDSITKLVSAYAIKQGNTSTLSRLLNREPDAIEFMYNHIQQLNNAEIDKATETRQQYNRYEGYIPSTNEDSISLIVSEDTNYADLITKGYKRIGDYKQSNLDKDPNKRGYYFNPTSNSTTFNQGGMLTAESTVGGVSAKYGTTIDSITGNAIIKPYHVSNISKGKHTTGEHLLPVFDENGEVIAYERSANIEQLKLINKDTNLIKMIAAWEGRQYEESVIEEFNEEMIQSLKTMYDDAYPADKAVNYINVLDPKVRAKDKILDKAMKLLSYSTIKNIEYIYGKENFFMVKKNLVNDVVGYHSASVKDIFSGNSRFTDETLKELRNLSVSLIGPNAYKYLSTAEKYLQAGVMRTKRLIVIKSILVPAANIVSNMFQLTSIMNPVDIIKAMPRKVLELNKYIKGRNRIQEINAEIRANRSTDSLLYEKLKIEQSFKRLGIWNLIEAGEFGSISNASVAREDILITEGSFDKYFNKIVDRLPEGGQTLVRNFLVTEDSPLFGAMKKVTDFGDFIAKATLYEHYIKQGQSNQEALNGIREEFVDMSRLNGRTQTYVESVGALWFMTFKIRMMKVALRIIRDKPFSLFVHTYMPHPKFIGSPMTDNLISKLLKGTLHYSVGPEQLFKGWLLNPFVNLII